MSLINKFGFGIREITNILIFGFLSFSFINKNYGQEKKIRRYVSSTIWYDKMLRDTIMGKDNVSLSIGGEYPGQAVKGEIDLKGSFEWVPATFSGFLQGYGKHYTNLFGGPKPLDKAGVRGGIKWIGEPIGPYIQQDVTIGGGVEAGINTDIPTVIPTTWSSSLIPTYLREAEACGKIIAGTRLIVFLGETDEGKRNEVEITPIAELKYGKKIKNVSGTLRSYDYAEFDFGLYWSSMLGMLKKTYTKQGETIRKAEKRVRKINISNKVLDMGMEVGVKTIGGGLDEAVFKVPLIFYFEDRMRAFFKTGYSSKVGPSISLGVSIGRGGGAINYLFGVDASPGTYSANTGIGYLNMGKGARF